MFYIKEEKSITVESVGGREASYDDFLNDLQRGGDSECRSVWRSGAPQDTIQDQERTQSACHISLTNIHIIRLLRYGLYDFEYEHQCQGTTDSSKKQKLFLMSWCPDRWLHPPCSSVWRRHYVSAPRSRKRCCTPHPSMLSRSLLSVCTNTSRYQDTRQHSYSWIQWMGEQLWTIFRPPTLAKRLRRLLRSSWDPPTEFEVGHLF